MSPKLISDKKKIHTDMLYINNKYFSITPEDLLTHNKYTNLWISPKNLTHFKKVLLCDRQWKTLHLGGYGLDNLLLWCQSKAGDARFLRYQAIFLKTHWFIHLIYFMLLLFTSFFHVLKLCATTELGGGHYAVFAKMSFKNP